jgi:hypothetical protein
MKHLPIRKTDLFAIIDDTDLESAMLVKWYLSPSGYVYGYFGHNNKRLLHRWLLNVVESHVLVDHRDRNPLNCRRENLRLCDCRLNTANSPRRINNQSGFKGVSWCTKEDAWRATITDHGKHRHIGYFNDPVVAARAYDKYATIVFGEFAFLNFPGEDNATADFGILRRNPASSVSGISLRKTGRWVARWTDPNGQRLNVGSFGSEADAIAALEDYKAKRNAISS